MTRRPAITLVEVLVSIFIMAIGLLALLVLFPLGALRMEQAIKADRAATCARQAYALAAARNMRADTVFYDPDAVTPRDHYVNPGNPAAWPPLDARPNYQGPSYPIFVDPIGQLAGNQALGDLGRGAPGIPRRGISFVQNAQQAVRWFSLLDDIQFDDNGVPAQPGGQILRSTRYSWALMLRRPRANTPGLVEMAVVVYSARPLFVGGGEPAYGGVNFDPASTSVLVTWDPATQERPPVRKGGWVLDATVLNAAGEPDPRGYFYRVVDVGEVDSPAGGPRAVRLELETAPRARTEGGVLVVMEYVTQVFDEGLGWKP